VIVVVLVLELVGVIPESNGSVRFDSYQSPSARMRIRPGRAVRGRARARARGIFRDASPPRGLKILKLAGFWIALFVFALRAAGEDSASQKPDFAAELPRLSNGAIVSLITYTPGEELYQAFGHSAIRIKDDSLEMDRLYNYGTFDFATRDFYLKFAHGDLLYQLAVTQAEEEIGTVAAYGQGVSEILLNLSQDQKQQLYEALEYNLLPANRFYRYDFILDNCSTRPRDVLERVTRSQIIEKEDGKLTFRQMLDPYFVRMPWHGFGLSLLLGANLDRIASPRQACFLPADLERAVESAQNGEQKLAAERREIFPPDMLPQTPVWLSPPVVFSFCGTAWFLWWFLRKQGHANWPSAIILTLSGATGLFLLGLSSWSRLWVVQENYNLAWLVPTHLIAGIWLFVSNKRPLIIRWYFPAAAVAGIAFISISFVLPQKFDPSVYPLAAVLTWRSILETKAKRRAARK